MRKRMFVAAVCGLLSAGGAFGQVADEPKPVVAGRSWVPEKAKKADDMADFREVRRLVADGGRAVLVVGGADGMLTAADKTVYRCPSLRDYEDGVYDCFRVGDQPKWQRRVPPAPVPQYVQPPAGFGLNLQLTGPLGNTVGVCVGRS